MPRSPRPSGRPLAWAVPALALVQLGLAGCASQQPQAAGPAPTPLAVYQALLGRNPGLTSLRAVAEARISFAGREVSLPGVLLLDTLGGFRLDLLDPLDRPVAILFAEDSRIVNYRPGPALAASLGVFPAECRGIDPADWVSSILASSIVPVAGETLADHGLWGSGRALERRRGGGIHQSIRYDTVAGEARPRQISWYCGEETVLQVRLHEWVQTAAWRLPTRFEVRFPKAGLALEVELREIEGNPPASGRPFVPRLGTEIRWTSWNLPQ